MDKIWAEIEALEQKELFHLLYQYNFYVIDVCDREDGSVPVCLPEFYTNEYQEIVNKWKE